MAEMRSCSIAELMGISKHKYFISNSELLWWQSRSSMKPLPAFRADMFHAESLVFASSHREIKEKQAFRDWFKKDQTKEWAEAQKKVTARQKQLDLDNAKIN